MESYPSQVLHQSYFTPARLLRHIILEFVALALLTATVLALWQGNSPQTWIPDETVGPPQIGLSSGRPAGSFSIREPHRKSRFDPEAFNEHRSKSIANDTRKLLGLAIALKSELDGSPGEPLRKDTANKAKEIEKLAHKVKEAMKINPNLDALD